MDNVAASKPNQLNEKNNFKKSMQKDKKVAKSKPITMTFGIR